MTAVDAPTVEQAELAAVVHRVLADLDVPAADVPLTIAALILGRPNIAEGLTARTQLPALQHLVDALRMRHKPVPVAEGERLICAATRKHPDSCDDCRLLWGAEG